MCIRDRHRTRYRRNPGVLCEPVGSSPHLSLEVCFGRAGQPAGSGVGAACSPGPVLWSSPAAHCASGATRLRRCSQPGSDYIPYCRFFRLPYIDGGRSTTGRPLANGAPCIHRSLRRMGLYAGLFALRGTRVIWRLCPAQAGISSQWRGWASPGWSQRDSCLRACLLYTSDDHAKPNARLLNYPEEWSGRYPPNSDAFIGGSEPSGAGLLESTAQRL